MHFIISFNFPNSHSIFLSGFPHVIYFLVKFSIAIILILFKMQNFDSHSRATESESAFLLIIPAFNKIPGDLYVL